MVEHQMGLFAEGFELIRSGKKTVEVRLNDEKRQQIKVADTVLFWLLPEKRDCIKTRVCEVKAYSSFKELYENTDFKLLGRADKTMDWMLSASYDYYSPEAEQTFGTVAIRLELVK